MTTARDGTIALVGAGEFLPPMLPVDKSLVERLNETPRVAIVPTASAPDGGDVPERWAKMGVEHFAQLGVAVEPVMLLNHADADDNAIVSQLAAANFVYFSGGKPRYLLETLQGTAAWQTILDMLARGGIVGGCSAGAMVLGAALFDFPQVWRTIPALGLVPGISVIPHFDEMPGWLTFATAPTKRKTTVVGIDGATALVGSNGQWMVSGQGGVTVFAGKSKIRYVAGQEVPLNLSEIGQ